MLESRSFYNYIVYENGQVWSNHSNKFLKPDKQKLGYLQISICVNGVRKRYKLHRLVAMLFIPNPCHLPQINHKDGNKENNHYSNLEWCDAYYNNKHARDNGLNNIPLSNSMRWNDSSFRRSTSKNISEGRIASGCANGDNNPSFRYVIKQHQKRIEKEDVARILGLSLSQVYHLLRAYSAGKIDPRLQQNGITVTGIKKSASTIENTA